LGDTNKRLRASFLPEKSKFNAEDKATVQSQKDDNRLSIVSHGSEDMVSFSGRDDSTMVDESSSLRQKKEIHRELRNQCEWWKQTIEYPSKFKEDFNSSDVLWDFATHIDSSFHDISPSIAREMKARLLSWYQRHRRKLPWRGDSLSSYHEMQYSDSTSIPVTGYSVWVSEVMLQQTRVETVIPYYVKWMKSFSTVQLLASASEEEVNSHWAGLGYYRRAKFLHQGARHVVDKLGGTLPQSIPELMTIPGIGKYTASAIASIAFGQNVPVVDGNVCRVFARLRAIANHIQAPLLKDSNLGCWKLANTLFSDCNVIGGNSTKLAPLVEFRPGDINQALMELGATLCAPIGSTGLEDDDPLAEFYLSTRIGKAMAERMIAPMSTSDSQKWDVHAFLSKAKQTRNAGLTRCQLCDPNGVDQVIIEIHKKLEGQNILNQANKESSEWLGKFLNYACTVGHSVFPLVNPRKAKREEFLGVALLSYHKDDDERWLMIKRPDNGLLAGQWEFPTVCLWNSATPKKRKGSSPATKVVTKDQSDFHVVFSENHESQRLDHGNESTPVFLSNQAMKKALDHLLGSISLQNEVSHESKWLLQPRVVVNNEPIEHIFSHVRHSMWIEYGAVSHDSNLDLYINSRWSTSDGREVRWLSQMDMNNVGITTGVKKILAVVRKGMDQS
jgi:A/G-specific adenine glycosylase